MGKGDLGEGGSTKEIFVDNFFRFSGTAVCNPTLFFIFYSISNGLTGWGMSVYLGFAR